MYQLNPASIESTKETFVSKKNTKESFINTNNKTYKNKKTVNFSQDENSENKTKLTNINNLLSKIHNNDNDHEEDNENNFNINENMSNTNKDLINSELQKMNSNNDNNLNNSSVLGSAVNTNYSNFQDSYKSNLEYLNNLNEKQGFDSSRLSTNYDNNQLITKLNYIIHLLEEQHNEKTNHITEELILYLFLGIFIIFVLDSFAKASKYIR